MKVYLDDEREAPLGWVRVHTPAAAIALLEAGIVSELSLDHDLGDDEGIGTGYDVLLWIEERVYTHREEGTDLFYVPPTKIKVHSANVSARKKMELAITSIHKQGPLNTHWNERAKNDNST